MEIRPLKKEDYFDCVNLLNQCFKEKSFSIEELQKENLKNTFFYGAFEEKELIGCVGLLQKSEKSYKIVRLAVNPSNRHKGYGKKLMAHAEKVATLIGGNKIGLGFIIPNEPLKNWYLKLGYEIQKIKRYKNSGQSICFAKKNLQK